MQTCLSNPQNGIVGYGCVFNFGAYVSSPFKSSGSLVVRTQTCLFWQGRRSPWNGLLSKFPTHHGDAEDDVCGAPVSHSTGAKWRSVQQCLWLRGFKGYLIPSSDSCAVQPIRMITRLTWFLSMLHSIPLSLFIFVKKQNIFDSSPSCQKWQVDLSSWLPSAWLLAVTSKRKSQISATMPLTPLQHLLISLFNKELASASPSPM